MTGTDGADALPLLPGARAQIRRIAADLEGGLHCLWLLPDTLVASGQGDELYRAVLRTQPDRLDLPGPAVPGPGPASEYGPGPGLGLEPGPGVGGGAAGGSPPGPPPADLPVLEGYDDGFDIGWQPVVPRPRAPAPRRGEDPADLVARLAKELSVAPGEVLARLTDRSAHWRPVIGVRAWQEPAPRAAPGRAPERGRDVARLVRSLTAAVKEAGLPLDRRPRLLVLARASDLPAALPDESELDLGAAAVHWWWGTVGRLDAATVVAEAADDRAARPRPGPGGALRERIRRAVREEIIAEVSGPDLALARRLASHWDGSDRTLDRCLRDSLDPDLGRLAAACRSVAGEAVAGHKPGSALRDAWSRGAVQAWEGRLRHHPAGWYADGPEHRPDELTALVGHAQQRVLLPWIEEVRRRLARLAPAWASRPVAQLVEAYVQRPPADHRTRPERAFETVEVGPMLTAHLRGDLALPPEEAQLLRELVTARNVLSHRGVLYDARLHALCDAIAAADRRWLRL
ncbi:hypothetical protein [Streptomyces sp. DH12]|uniref:hypothetical protein n=1 Tax=Streptomyces sp. DH12 TaxID=2857010 RepID=UPI001E4DFF65|nr:hypothetical protein [Streptomyces sp. DH12]